MAFGTQTVTHTSSFDVVNGVDGVKEATREIFDNIAFENMNNIEAFRLRNTFIASNNFEGGFNENVRMEQISQSNPAGSFRSTLVPKQTTSDFKTIKSLGDVKFTSFEMDDIVLPIDTYIWTGNPKKIYAIDSNSWLVSDIESAASGTAISGLVREINFRTYETIKTGALSQIDPELGAQGRVAQAETAPADFTNDYIDDVASLGALPYDRYISGLTSDELVGVITPVAQAKILKEKLIIYDGQFMGEEGKFFTGLPYSHRFAGTYLHVTKFLNRGHNDEVDAEYILINPGKWSPFLFHAAKFAGRAEVIPFTDGAIGIYGTSAFGMKVEEKLSQYLVMRTTSAPTTKFTSNFTKAYGKGTAADKITAYATVTGTDKAWARVSAIDAAVPGTWTELTGTLSLSHEFTGLTSGEDYRLEIGTSTDAGSAPESVDGQTLSIVTTVKTL